jgi:hypothetical protein
MSFIDAQTNIMVTLMIHPLTYSMFTRLSWIIGPIMINRYLRDLLEAPGYVAPLRETNDGISTPSSSTTLSAPNSPSTASRRLARQPSPSFPLLPSPSTPSSASTTQSPSATATTPGGLSSPSFAAGSTTPSTMMENKINSTLTNSSNITPLTISVGGHTVPALSPPPSPLPPPFAFAHSNVLSPAPPPTSLLDWLLQYLPHASAADIRLLTMQSGVLPSIKFTEYDWSMFYFKPAPDVRKPSFDAILRQGGDKNQDGATLVPIAFIHPALLTLIIWVVIVVIGTNIVEFT